MRILDIDLDFFLDGVTDGVEDGDRENASMFIPWSADRVVDYLAHNCGLSADKPISGRVVTHHDKALYDWRDKIECGMLTAPFEVVHVDAHADLGLGGDAYDYIMREFLAKDPADRVRDLSLDDKVNCGNYLLFALACRWLRDLTYVHHPNGGSDCPEYCISRDHTNNLIAQLSYFGPGWTYPDDWDNQPEPISREPPIPFRAIPAVGYQNSEPFDFVYLATSPRWTPRTSDPLIDIVREYIASTK